jgi:polysaccharide chain length determinant protein (PEP-CTERM system associated)
MPAHTTPTIRPEFHPLSLLRAIWKNRVAAFCVAIITACTGILVTHQLPKVYVAEALVLVDPQKIPERFVSPTVSEDFSDRLATMSQEIMSSTRLKRIIDDFNLYADKRKSHVWDEIIEMMRHDIDIRVEKGAIGGRPGAFRILFTAGDPVVAANVVNRITSLYIEENLRDRENQSTGASEFLETQLEEAKRTLDIQEAEVSRYKLQHNGELPQQENSLMQTLSRLQTELQGNQDAINRAQQNKIGIESALSAAETSEAALRRRYNAVDSDGRPAAARAPKQSETLRTQLEAARIRYGDDHPDVRKLRTQLAAAQAREAQEPSISATQDDFASRQRAQAEKSLAMASDPELARSHEHIETLRAQLMVITRELETRNADRTRIIQQLQGYEGRVGQLPVREQEMASLTRDYEFSKTNYRSLLDKKIAAEMATDLEKRQKAERFRILDPARPPQKPFKRRSQQLYIASLLGSLIFGVFVAFVIEQREGVVLGPWELPQDVPILARITRIDPVFAGAAKSEI